MQPHDSTQKLIESSKAGPAKCLVQHKCGFWEFLVKLVRLNAAEYATGVRILENWPLRFAADLRQNEPIAGLRIPSNF
jgi:hypothetical protein